MRSLPLLLVVPLALLAVGCSTPAQPGNGESGLLQFTQAIGPADLAVGAPADVSVYLPGETPWHCTHSTPCGPEDSSDVARASCDDAACTAEVVGPGVVRVTPARAGELRLRVTMAKDGASDTMRFVARPIDELRIHGEELDSFRDPSAKDPLLLLERARLAFHVQPFGEGRPLDVRPELVTVTVSGHEGCEGVLCTSDYRDGARSFRRGPTHGLVVAKGKGAIEARLGERTARLEVEGIAGADVAALDLERVPAIDARPSREGEVVTRIDLVAPTDEVAFYRARLTTKDGRRAFGTAPNRHRSEGQVGLHLAYESIFTLAQREPASGSVTVEAGPHTRIVPVSITAPTR